jgi:hypothetical protein
MLQCCIANMMIVRGGSNLFSLCNYTVHRTFSNNEKMLAIVVQHPPNVTRDGTCVATTLDEEAKQVPINKR